jgi:uncharacterized protein
VSLRPSCDREEYVFVGLDSAPAGLEPVATVAEPEGLTAVLRREDADRRGYAYDFVAARVVLEAVTDLGAIGLTAAVAGALAQRGIACNVFAGLHHDHLFVPYDLAAEAVAAIGELQWPERT